MMVPIFIFTGEQVDPAQNKYFSHPAVQFMCESLVDLDHELRKCNSQLHVFYTKHGNVVDQLELINKHSSPGIRIRSITQNRDFSEYAKKRDAAIKEWCDAQSPQVAFNECEDYDLVSSEDLLLPISGSGSGSGSGPMGKPYTVLAAYYNRFMKESDIVVRKCTKKVATFSPNSESIYLKNVPNRIACDLDTFQKMFYTHNENLAQRGGRKRALARLKQINLDNYDKNRNYPALEDGTTRLSAHLKFGTISVRELYWFVVNTIGKGSPFIRELVFRSFYIKMCTSTHTRFKGMQRGVSFRQDIDDKIPWVSISRSTSTSTSISTSRSKSNKSEKAKVLWDAWTQGRTGFPLVDAGMRQLNETGWMHGRVRMVAAAVLTRYCLIDWREGALYFAQHLVDYDPISNNMGWQFAAALGENSQNIYRAPMNPTLQLKTYDPQGVYVARYLSKSDMEREPTVDQKAASARAVALWKAAAA